MLYLNRYPFAYEYALTTYRMDHPFTTVVDVRYRDLDPLGHVNHAVHVSYLEVARVEYFEQILDVDLTAVETAIASVDIAYHRPITPDGQLVVEMQVTDIGTTSLTTEAELRVDGEQAASATVVMVNYDREKRAAQPIPDAWREAITAFEGL